jgi:hypothetical protein
MVTTDSDHEREVDLHTARRMKRTRINQQWVADITSIAGVRLFGCDSGRLAKGCGLGLGRQPGSRSGTSRLRKGGERASKSLSSGTTTAAGCTRL